MKLTITPKAVLFLAFFVMMSMGAGFLNGLVGTGAGIVFLLLSRITGGDITKDTFAFSMSCVIPLSAFSLFTYRLPAALSLSTFLVTLLTGVAGGVLGAFLQQRLKIGVLKKIFAVIVIYSGLRMVLG